MSLVDTLSVASMLFPGAVLLYRRQQEEAASVRNALRAGRERVYVDRLANPPFIDVFTQRLKATLNYFDTSFGTPFSYESNSLTTNLAVFYSFAVFFAIWLFGGSGRIGEIQVLDDTMDQRLRIVLSFGYFLLLMLTYTLLKPKKARPAILRRASVHRTLQLLVLLPYIAVAATVPTYWILGVAPSNVVTTVSTVMFAGTLAGGILFVTFANKTGAVVFAITFASAVAGAATVSTGMRIQEAPWSFVAAFGALIVTLSSIFLISRWFGPARVYFLNLAMVGASFATVMWFPSALKMDQLSGTLIYFFVVLPFLNGVLDWLSLSFCRIISGRILARPSISILATHAILASLVALSMLTLLIVAFIVATDLFNVVLRKSNSVPIPVGTLIELAMAHPLSNEGLWITIMLGSTLVPPSMLLAISIAAIFVKYSFAGYRAWLVRLIRAGRQPELASNRVAWFFTLVNLTSLTLTVTAVALLVYLLQPVVSNYAYRLAVWSHSLV